MLKCYMLFLNKNWQTFKATEWYPISCDNKAFLKRRSKILIKSKFNHIATNETRLVIVVCMETRCLFFVFMVNSILPEKKEKCRFAVHPTVHFADFLQRSMHSLPAADLSIHVAVLLVQFQDAWFMVSLTLLIHRHENFKFADICLAPHITFIRTGCFTQ